MRVTTIVLMAVASLTMASTALATTIDFDSISSGASVDSYYAGGMDSAGEVGPNYGVTFTPGDWITLSGFGETSQPNLAFSASGLGVIDFASGTPSISFTYGGFTDSTLNVYSGLDGTGTLLASDLLPANDPNAFSFESLPFTGTAMSVVLSAGSGQFGLDDLTFGAVPEPASWAMMVLGFALAGAAVRKRAVVGVVTA
jgi:hypothetical protein